jgi:hypothetical protein
MENNPEFSNAWWALYSFMIFTSLFLILLGVGLQGFVDDCSNIKGL